MTLVCRNCGAYLTEEERRAGFSLCSSCRSADPWAEEVHWVKRCPNCGRPLRFGVCWACLSKDGGKYKPCDPGLLELGKKLKKR